MVVLPGIEGVCVVAVWGGGIVTQCIMRQDMLGWYLIRQNLHYDHWQIDVSVAATIAVVLHCCFELQ